MNLKSSEVVSSDGGVNSPLLYPLEERYTSAKASNPPIRASSTAYPGCPTIAAPKPTMKAVAEPAIIGRWTAISIREPNSDTVPVPPFYKCFLLCKDSITRRK